MAQKLALVCPALHERNLAMRASQHGSGVVVVVVVVVVVAESMQRGWLYLLQALRVQAPVLPRSHEHVLQPSNQERHDSGHWPLGWRLQPTAPAQSASHWFEYVKPSPHLTGSNFF